MEASYLSETVTEKCRICKLNLLRKNYKAHLRNVHPEENEKDLSGWTQPKITSIFSHGNIKRKKGQGDHTNEPKINEQQERVDNDNVEIVQNKIIDHGASNCESQEDQSLIINHDDHHNQTQNSLLNEAIMDELGTKRKKFRSGDSAFGDTPDSDHTELKPLEYNIESQTTKLDLVLKQLQDIKLKINELKKDNLTKNTEKSSSSGDMVSDPEQESALMVLQCSRSMEDFENIGFEYDQESQKVKCTVCMSDDNQTNNDCPITIGVFKYSPLDGLNFNKEEKMSRNFTNLKRSLKRHILKGQGHCFKLKEKMKKEEADLALISKNKIAGLNIGKIAMKNYLQGRPLTDFENDILIMKGAGGVVGDINHSRDFPAKYRKSVCRVINGRIKKFLQTPLKQTGHLPPVAVSADKGTYKGTPRQFCGVVTVNPGGENFIEVLTAGQPVVSEGSTGYQLAVNMKSGFDYIGIRGKQIKSGVFDGVYDHISIEKHLGELYPDMNKVEFLFTHDPLHRTGLEDKHMCNAKGEHKWINAFNEICHQLYVTFSWGASHVKLRDAARSLDIRPRNLVNFSPTRFANSKSKVYQIILDQFPAIMVCLDHYIIEGEKNRSGLTASNKEIREKADTARELKGKIMNSEFLLVLSGLCDIYEQFGAVVQVILF